jgi:hypothetical protein
MVAKELRKLFKFMMSFRWKPWKFIEVNYQPNPFLYNILDMNPSSQKFLDAFGLATLNVNFI